MTTPPPPQYFASAADIRRWLETHHDAQRELVVGFHKVGTGTPSMTWSESPRKAGSIWSAVNLQHITSLIAAGRMHPAGVSAYAARSETKSKVYAFEQKEVALSAHDLAQFAATPHALAFFEQQPAGYRKTATWWVIGAKQPATRARRLAQLIACSAHGGRRR